jgi:hypothetical protein
MRGSLHSAGSSQGLHAEGTAKQQGLAHVGQLCLPNIDDGLVAFSLLSIMVPAMAAIVPHLCLDPLLPHVHPFQLPP